MVDQYNEEVKRSFDDIKKHIRGLRLLAPLEGLRKRFAPAPVPRPSGRYELTQKQLETVTELINKRAINQAGNSYAVHPPRKLIDRPEILSSDRVVDELEDESFFIVFQDGSGYLLALHELVFFTAQLISLAIETQQIAQLLDPSKLPNAEVKVSLKTNFSMDDLMKPDSVRIILSKIEFSKIASDDESAEGETVADEPGQPMG